MSMTEVKGLFESGQRLRPQTMKRLEAELKRKCKYRECGKSLAFTHRHKTFCNVYCKRKEQSRIRQANREKKLRYYEKHGIVHKKSVKRQIGKTTGIEPQGFTLIYENYKLPLQEIPKSTGYGCYGTLAQTEDKQYIQCHICGKLFVTLPGHLKAHRLTAPEYKEKFQLMKSTALVSDTYREGLQARIAQRIKERKLILFKELPEHLRIYNEEVKSGEIKHAPNYNRNTWTLERRNKEGLCPDQVLEKIKELAEILGKTPSSDEFREHYKSKYYQAIQYLHGSWSNAVKKAKLTTRDELRKPDPEKLLQDLVDFKEKHGHIPMTSDFNRGLLRDRGVYIRTFGSLNNARVEAGLNAILPLPFGQQVEMTPEEYIKYKAGGRYEGFKNGGEQARKKRAARQRRRERLALSN